MKSSIVGMGLVRRYIFAFAAAGVLNAGPVPANKPSTCPEWWFEHDIIAQVTPNDTTPDFLLPYTYARADDYGAVNTGQLKNMATKARIEFEAVLSGGAGANINSMVLSWQEASSTNDDYAAVNLGQLKAVAAKFYDRLDQFHYMGPPISDGRTYPWSGVTSQADDYALANLGQLKYLFSFNPRHYVFSQNQAVAVGDNHTLALMRDGTVWAWGGNGYGQLGNGTTTMTPYPLRVEGLSSITAIAAGFDRSFALRSDGTVWAWGNNAGGRLGDGTVNSRFQPVVISGLSGVIAIAAGSDHSLALKQDGTVWAWGKNSWGQLGDGTANSGRLSPEPIASLDGVVAITAGISYSLAVKADGTVWAWGSNQSGVLGTNYIPITFSATPIRSGTITDVIAIAAGHQHVLALKSDGTVWAWGRNVSGQLGDNTTTGRGTAGLVALTGQYTAISAGADNSAALKADGTLYTWGSKYYGQIGDGTKGDSVTLPVAVPSLGRAMAIATGHHTVTVNNQGQLLSWGSNNMGQLGLDSDVTQWSPPPIFKLSSPSLSPPGGRYIAPPTVAVVSLDSGASYHYTFDGAEPTDNSPSVPFGAVLVPRQGILKVKAFKPGAAPSETKTGIYVKENDIVAGEARAVCAGRNHTLALKAEGTVWTCGANNYGQLGDVTMMDRATFEKVVGLNDIVSVGAGKDYSIALRSDGTVWAWGYNADGQLGNGTMTPYEAIPVQVAGLTGIVAIDAGAFFSLAVKSDGTVFEWGLLRLSNGAPRRQTTPIQVSGLNEVVSLAAGVGALALKRDGTTWGWVPGLTPSEVTGLTGILSIAAGDEYSMALKNDGTVWTWGGTGWEMGYQVLGYNLPPKRVNGIGGIVSIAAGSGFSLAVDGEGSVWAWGDNDHRQLGDGTIIGRYTPGRVIGATDVLSVSVGQQHAMALRKNGTVLAWGGRANGLLGDGLTQLRTSPTQINQLTAITAAAMGHSTYSYALVVKDDGTVWGWGSNRWGVLGNGTTTSQPMPVQVSDLTGVSSVSAGLIHSVALKDDGTVWTWGYNGQGQLGDGTAITESLTPVQVTQLMDVKLICANVSTMALKNDGSVWAWGQNNYGTIGDGTKINRTTPVPVIGLSGVASLAAGGLHSVARKTDGTVWGWGNNEKGQLGDGTTTDRLIPGPVNGLSGVVSVSAGTYHSLALKGDGTVWGWGDNAHGQLGDGGATSRTTPAQVSGLSEVVSIATGNYTSFAVKSDGTVWAWGRNTTGQLGDGTLINRTLPVQVVGLFGAVAVTAAYENTLVIMSDGTLRAWGASQEDSGYGALGLAGTSPVSAAGIRLTASPDDTDEDGMSDTWEVTHFGGLVQIESDPDYDGVTNFQEHFLGTDPQQSDEDQDRLTDSVDPHPHDYYNQSGISPVITVNAGDNQSASTGEFNASALDVLVRDPTGTFPLVNVPVSFEVVSGGGLLAIGKEGYQLAPIVTVRTNSDGVVRCHYRHGSIPNTISKIKASASSTQVLLTSLTLLDTTKPSSTPSLFATGITSSSFMLNWLAAVDDFSVGGYDIFQNGIQIGSSATTNYKVISLAPATSYSMTVTSRDVAGNMSAASAVLDVVTLADSTVPTTPTGLSAAHVAATGFTLTWRASSDNVAIVSYDIFRNGVMISSSVTTTCLVTHLSPLTGYSLAVKARDAAGNVSAASAALLVTTLADTTAPTSPRELSANFPGATECTINWGLSSDNVGVDSYQIFRNGVMAGSSLTPTYKVIGLAPLSTYAITVTATDAAGNVSAVSEVLSVTTAADATPPSRPNGLTLSEVTATGMVLSWNESADNVGVTGYQIFQGGAQIGTSSTNSYRGTKLMPNTAYGITIKARDAAGNKSVASEVLTVITPPDTSAPSVPIGLSANNLGVVSFTLNWSPSSDDVAAVGYDVFQNGMRVGSSEVPSYIVYGLLPSTTYLFSVAGRDGAGNVSASSDSLSVTTAADVTPPTRPELTVSQLNTTSFTVRPTSYDDGAVVGYDIIKNGVSIGSWPNSDYFETNLSSSTTYGISMRARDAAGNVSPWSVELPVTTFAPHASFAYTAGFESVEASAWQVLYRTDMASVIDGGSVSLWTDERGSSPLYPVNPTAQPPSWVQVEGGIAAVEIRGNAAGDYLKTDAVLAGMDTSRFSFLCLIRPIGDAVTPPQIDMGANESTSFRFWVDNAAGNRLKVSTGGGNIMDNIPHGSVENNQWEYWAFTFNEGEGKLYKGGELVATRTGMTAPSSWLDLQVGRNSSMWLVELAVVSQPLTATQVSVYRESLRARYSAFFTGGRELRPADRIPLIVPESGQTILNGCTVNIAIEVPIEGHIFN